MERSPFSTDPSEGVQWDTPRRLQRVQVFGAGRAVGREVVAELLRSGHPAGGLGLFGRRARSFSYGGSTLTVEPIHGNLPQAELAFVCTSPQLGAQLVPILASRGTRVVDLSGFSARQADVPFIVHEINAQDIGAFSELVALPHRTALILARLLWVLERQAGLEEVSCFATVAAAAEGARGILAVREELAERANGVHTSRAPEERRVGNLLPVGGNDDQGEGPELEQLLANDVRRAIRRQDLVLDLMASEADVERCDSFAVKAVMRAPLEAVAAAELFGTAPGIVVECSPAGPIPAACAGSGAIHVGRIRAGSGGPRSLCFFAVADQLRVGAALAALQVAKELAT